MIDVPLLVLWYVLAWVGCCLVGAALAFPLVSRLCSPLEGDGAGFSFPAAIVVVTGVAFLVGQFSFGPIAVLAGVATLFATAIRYRETAIRWRAFGEAVVVFLLGFAFVVGLQYFHVGIVPIHEHFLNYGILNSLVESSSLPPEDVWFAGEPLRYYYGGHLAAAILVLITGTPPTYAFPLALAMYYGLLLTAAYELGGAIGSHVGRHRSLSGGLSAFFVGVAGNLFVPVVWLLHYLPSAVERRARGAISSGFSDGA